MIVTARIKRKSETGSKVVIEFTSGTKTKEAMLHKTDFAPRQSPDEDTLTETIAIMKHEIFKSGATTAGQIEAVIDAMEIHL